MPEPFRLTYPTAAVLLAIRAGHLYGFDVMDVTGLPDGTVYPILRRLEDKGALTGQWESTESAAADGRPPRRYYQLTPLGVESMELALSRFPVLGQVIGLGADPTVE
jgi:PadR family transcriptional regulator PadR